MSILARGTSVSPMTISVLVLAIYLVANTETDNVILILSWIISVSPSPMTIKKAVD